MQCNVNRPADSQLLPFLAALMLSSMIAHVTLLAFPYRGYAIDPPPPVEPEPVVHMVYVCLPKDETRHPQTLPWARTVQVETFKAADVAPHVQAQENRKPQKRKRTYARASW